MKLLSQLRDLLLRRKPVTSSGRPSSSNSAALQVDAVPPFHLGMVDLMRYARKCVASWKQALVNRPALTW